MTIKLTRITGVYELDGGKTVDVVINYDNQAFAQERLQIGGFTGEFVNSSMCFSPLTRKYLTPRSLFYNFDGRDLQIYFQSRDKMDAFLLDPEHAGLIGKVDYGSFSGGVASMINPPDFSSLN